MSAPERAHPSTTDPATQRAGPTTASTRKTAALVGLLFLAATVALIFADTLTSGVLDRPDFLAGATLQATAPATGAILLAGQFGVVGIAVLLYRSRLVPRWIVLFGVIGYPALLAGCVLDVFGVLDVTEGVGMIAFVPGGLFELILPIWLLTKGFAFPGRDRAELGS
jgi:hypothetical protein